MIRVIGRGTTKKPYCDSEGKKDTHNEIYVIKSKPASFHAESIAHLR